MTALFPLRVILKDVSRGERGVGGPTQACRARKRNPDRQDHKHYAGGKNLCLDGAEKTVSHTKQPPLRNFAKKFNLKKM
jgi:hypothetical protein